MAGIIVAGWDKVKKGQVIHTKYIVELYINLFYH